MNTIRNKILLIFISILSFNACTSSKNDKTAIVYFDNHSWNVRLTGKRVPLVHDFISMIFSKSVNDTIVFPLPNYIAGKDYYLLGKDIPVPEYNYKYQGDVEFIKNKMIVNLLIDDTSKKKLVPEIWNGEYKVKVK